MKLASVLQGNWRAAPAVAALVFGLGAGSAQAVITEHATTGTTFTGAATAGFATISGGAFTDPSNTIYQDVVAEFAPGANHTLIEFGGNVSAVFGTWNLGINDSDFGTVNQLDLRFLSGGSLVGQTTLYLDDGFAAPDFATQFATPFGRGFSSDVSFDSLAIYSGGGGVGDETFQVSSFSFQSVTTPVDPGPVGAVPEPAAVTMMLAALGVLTVAARRRKMF
jgi:hypothetical protein